MECNTSGGLRGLCGSVERENVGPFLPNRRVTSGGAVLGQVSGVGMPFF